MKTFFRTLFLFLIISQAGLPRMHGNPYEIHVDPYDENFEIFEFLREVSTCLNDHEDIVLKFFESDPTIRLVLDGIKTVIIADFECDGDEDTYFGMVAQLFKLQGHTLLVDKENYIELSNGCLTVKEDTSVNGIKMLSVANRILQTNENIVSFVVTQSVVSQDGINAIKEGLTTHQLTGGVAFVECTLLPNALCELCEALSHRRDLAVLNLTRCALGTTTFTPIANLINRIRLGMLFLFKSGLTKEALEQIFESLARDKNITTIDFSLNDISDTYAIQFVTRLLKRNKFIERIYLTSNPSCISFEEKVTCKENFLGTIERIHRNITIDLGRNRIAWEMRFDIPSLSSNINIQLMNPYIRCRSEDGEYTRDSLLKKDSCEDPR